MQRRNLTYLVVGCISLILIFSLNVMAAYDDKDVQMPFKTDMTDRTMLKEILVNQGKTHALLNEIKALIKELK